MIVKVKVFDIDYDKDECEVKLPTDLELEIDTPSIQDLEDLIADQISNETGWLVNSYNYEIKTIECTDGICRMLDEYYEWITNLQELAEQEPLDLTGEELEALQNEGLDYD